MKYLWILMLVSGMSLLLIPMIGIIFGLLADTVIKLLA
jgi:hypothetical protein